MSELTEPNIEEMRLHLEKWRADEQEQAHDQGLDARRLEVRQEMLVFLDKFISGQIDLNEFRTTFDRHTRKKWDVFGLKAMSGAMFLNTLVKHINDQEDLVWRLRQLLPVPANEEIARRNMADFYNYLMGLIDAGEITKRQVQPSRLPFFTSGWWHLQEIESWPIFYTSGRKSLREAGFYDPSDEPVADYFEFRSIFQALQAKLGISSWDLEHILDWEEEDPAKTAPITKPVVSEVPVEVDEEDIDQTNQDEMFSHSHIQWLLATIGRKLGCRIWIARNDHKRTWQGHELGKLSLKQLPRLGLDDESQRTIGLIDVIWLDHRNKVAAAFEVEHTTSIYSGLLRMSDLLADAPNLNFPLYIVAQEARREKVRQQLSRPTFQALGLHEQCGFIAFETLVENADPIMRWADNPQAVDKLANKIDERTGQWV